MGSSIGCATSGNILPCLYFVSALPRHPHIILLPILLIWCSYVYSTIVLHTTSTRACVSNHLLVLLPSSCRFFPWLFQHIKFRLTRAKPNAYCGPKKYSCKNALPGIFTSRLFNPKNEFSQKDSIIFKKSPAISMKAYNLWIVWSALSMTLA